MKKKTKILPILLIILIAFSLVLFTSACNNSSSEKDASLLNVSYFHGDENMEKIVKDKGKVSEINGNALLDLLYKEKVISKPVLVDKFYIETNEKEKKTTLYLDLTNDFYDVIKNTGTTGEYIILGSIVNTFITAFKVDEIFLTIEDSILTTGHNIYDYPLTFFPLD